MCPAPVANAALRVAGPVSAPDVTTATPVAEAVHPVRPAMDTARITRIRLMEAPLRRA